MNDDALGLLRAHIQTLIDLGDRRPLTKAQRLELAELITALDDAKAAR